MVSGTWWRHGETVATTYDRAGNVKTVTDAKSHTTTSSYDARGRLATRTNRLSGSTIWTFDANGNLLTLRDAETQTTAYEYDVRNLKTKETYPDHVSGSGVGTAGYGIVEFAYDPARRLERKTDQLGDTVTYVFDKAGRLTQRDYRTQANSPSGTISDSDVFTYDLASRMLTATSGRYSNTLTQTYDVIGRMKTEALTYAGQTYTVARDFDSVSRLSRLTYPDGSLVDRTYTARGQLYQVKYNSSVINTRAYDNGGRLSTSTYGNGVVTTHTYRNDNLTTLIDSHTCGGQMLISERTLRDEVLLATFELDRAERALARTLRALARRGPGAGELARVKAEFAAAFAEEEESIEQIADNLRALADAGFGGALCQGL